MQPQAEKSSTARHRIEIKKAGGQRNSNPPAPSIGIGTMEPAPKDPQIPTDGHEEATAATLDIRSMCVGSHLNWPLHYWQSRSLAWLRTTGFRE